MELDLKYKRFNCSRKIGCLLISTIRLYYFVKQPRKLTSQFPELVRPPVFGLDKVVYVKVLDLVLVGGVLNLQQINLAKTIPKNIVRMTLQFILKEKNLIDFILGALELLFLNKNDLKSTYNKHNRQNTINYHSKSGISMEIAQQTFVDKNSSSVKLRTFLLLYLFNCKTGRN